MELLHRLYKIASSRVPRLDKDDKPADGGASGADFSGGGPRARTKPHEPGDGGPRSDSGQPGRPGEDPQLAVYYANLEIPYGSDLDQVRQAWKRLVRRYHPDLHSADPEKRRIANELTQGLNRAYEELQKRLDQTP